MANEAAINDNVGQRGFGCVAILGVCHGWYFTLTELNRYIGEDRCGANGLPMAPTAVRMMARLHSLFVYHGHSHLCSYVDAQRDHTGLLMNTIRYLYFQIEFY